MSDDELFENHFASIFETIGYEWLNPYVKETKHYKKNSVNIIFTNFELTSVTQFFRFVNKNLFDNYYSNQINPKHNLSEKAEEENPNSKKQKTK